MAKFTTRLVATGGWVASIVLGQWLLGPTARSEPSQRSLGSIDVVGTVIDERGIPVANAPIHVTAAPEGEDEEVHFFDGSEEVLASTTTDLAGHFRVQVSKSKDAVFIGPAPRDLGNVESRRSERSPIAALGLRFDLHKFDNGKQLLVTAWDGYYLTGTLVNESGTQCTDMSVKFEADTGWSAEGEVADGGRFVIGPLPEVPGVVSSVDKHERQHELSTVTGDHDETFRDLGRCTVPETATLRLGPPRLEPQETITRICVCRTDAEIPFFAEPESVPWSGSFIEFLGLPVGVYSVVAETSLHRILTNESAQCRVSSAEQPLVAVGLGRAMTLNLQPCAGECSWKILVDGRLWACGHRSPDWQTVTVWIPPTAKLATLAGLVRSLDLVTTRSIALDESPNPIVVDG